MALTPRLDSLEAMFRKLEREFVRAFHHANLTHKADHFYNFCITAHSVRDYLLERLGKIKKADTKPFNDAWSKIPVLVAVADVANTAKHFQLRNKDGSPRSSHTKHVRHGKTTMAEVYINDRGELIVKKKTGAPTYVIEVEGGGEFELYAFMDEVVSHWKQQLKSHGIRTRRQSLAQLHGT